MYGNHVNHDRVVNLDNQRESRMRLPPAWISAHCQSLFTKIVYFTYELSHSGHFELVLVADDRGKPNVNRYLMFIKTFIESNE